MTRRVQAESEIVVSSTAKCGLRKKGLQRRQKSSRRIQADELDVEHKAVGVGVAISLVGVLSSEADILAALIYLFATLLGLFNSMLISNAFRP